MPLGLYCWKNWLCHLCKSFGGSSLQNSGTLLLLVLLIPFLIRCCLTIFKTLFMWGVVLGNFLAPLPLACSLSSTPSVSIVVPVMEADAIIEALHKQLQPEGHALHCPRAAPSAGIVICTHHQSFRPLASGGGAVNYLFLVDPCNAFCSSGVVFTCLVLLVSLAALRGLTQYACTVVALLLLMKYTWFMSAQFFSHLANNMLLCLHQTLISYNTMRSISA